MEITTADDWMRRNSLLHQLLRLRYGEFFSADKGIAKYSHGLEIIGQLKKRSASGNVSKVPGALSKLTDDLKAFIKTNIPYTRTSNSGGCFWNNME